MGRVFLREVLLRRGDLLRALSSAPPSSSLFVRRFQTGGEKDSSAESSDDFKKSFFGDLDGGKGIFGDLDDRANSDPIFRSLDRSERSFLRSNVRRKVVGDERKDLGETEDTLADGLDDRLRRHSRKFFKQSDEIYEPDYAFRPDVTFREGDTYTLKDLDLTKPAPPRPRRRKEFETTTGEVLRKADFRNVRFLSNFITEAGIIIKRSQTGISAKAQRKVAREIKTARALGLMPFTAMGTKYFIFGKNMKDDHEDYEYNDYDEQAGINDMPDVEPIKR